MSKSSHLYGTRIRKFRLANNLTQGKLCELTGIDQGQLSRIENGLAEGSPSQLADIAHALGVSMSDLFADKVSEPTPAEQYEPKNLAAQIRHDCDAPAGLRDLASDAGLQKALAISNEEWKVLASIQLTTPATKHGYVQLLLTIRAITERPDFEPTVR
jgi:transcriptional regulator with XRE-family HTH domain